MIDESKESLIKGLSVLLKISPENLVKRLSINNQYDLTPFFLGGDNNLIFLSHIKNNKTVYISKLNLHYFNDKRLFLKEEFFYKIIRKEYKILYEHTPLYIESKVIKNKINILTIENIPFNRDAEKLNYKKMYIYY